MPGSRSSGPDAAVLPAEARSAGEPLGLTVHSVPRLDAEALEQRTRSGRLRMMLVLLVCAAPVIASYFTYYVIRPQGRSNYAELIQPTRTMPAALPLTTLAGQPLAASGLRRQWLLVSVSPSSCDAPCQQRLYMQRQLHQMLGRERDRVDKLWLLTDAGQPDAALVGALTQGPEGVQVLRVPREQLVQWLAPAPGRTLEEHLYIIDPMGEWMMRSPPSPDPQKLKRDLDRLLRASAWWDTAGR